MCGCIQLHKRVSQVNGWISISLLQRWDSSSNYSRWALANVCLIGLPCVGQCKCMHVSGQVSVCQPGVNGN